MLAQAPCGPSPPPLKEHKGLVQAGVSNKINTNNKKNNGHYQWLMLTRQTLRGLCLVSGFTMIPGGRYSVVSFLSRMEPERLSHLPTITQHLTQVRRDP